MSDNVRPKFQITEYLKMIDMEIKKRHVYLY